MKLKCLKLLKLSLPIFILSVYFCFGGHFTNNAKADTISQTDNSTSINAGNYNGIYQAAQSIQESESITISNIRLSIQDYWSIISGVYLTIRTDDGGHPSNTVVSTSNVLSRIGGGYNYYDFSFSYDPAVLNGGQKYWIVTEFSNYSYSHAVDVQATNNPDLYPNGGESYAEYNGGSPLWTSRSLYNDLYFIITYEPATFCGDTVCQTGTENCTTCPGDCGTCPINSPYINQQLFYFSSPYNCALGSTCKINYSYNQNVISQYDYIEIFQMSDDQTTSTSLGTSTIIEPNGIFQDKVNGLSNYVFNTNPTSSKKIIYKTLAHLAAYYDPTLNENIAATTTPGSNFSVSWTGQPDVAGIIQGINQINASSTATTTILGISAHNLACSEDKWTTPWLENWFGSFPPPQFLACVAFEGVIDSALKLTNIVKLVVEGAVRVLSVSFPFNVPINIKNSWDQATLTQLPGELSWLAIGDESGNITVDIPPLYSTGTSTTWTVWGPNLWGNTAFINTMLSHWRALTKYLLWAAWIFLAIYGLANTVIKKIE